MTNLTRSRASTAVLSVTLLALVPLVSLARSSDLSAGLVSYWQLNGDSVDSLSANDGFDTSVSYAPRFGKKNKGALFDGNTSGIYIGSPSNLNLLSDMSIALWVYPVGGAGSSVFSKTIENGASDNAFDFQVTADGPMQFVYANGSYYYIDSNVHVPANQWSFIAVTRSEGNSQVRFYLNGQDAGTSDDHWAAITPVSTGPVYIGRRDSDNRFAGYLDELGVWNRALSPAEIQTLYKQGHGTSYPF